MCVFLLRSEAAMIAHDKSQQEGKKNFLVPCFIELSWSRVWDHGANPSYRLACREYFGPHSLCSLPTSFLATIPSIRSNVCRISRNHWWAIKWSNWKETPEQYPLEFRPKSWRPNFFRLGCLGLDFFFHLVSWILSYVLLGVLTFFIAHWVGCFWFIAGAFEVRNYSFAWPFKELFFSQGFGVNEWVPSLDLVSSPLSVRYLQAFYWGFINGMFPAWFLPFCILSYCLS